MNSCGVPTSSYRVLNTNVLAGMKKRQVSRSCASIKIAFLRDLSSLQLNVHIIFIWYAVSNSDMDGRLEASPHDQLPGLARFALMGVVRQLRRAS